MQVKIDSVATLGHLIKAVRKSQKIRQEDLADMVDRSHVYVGDVEKGKSQVNIGSVFALCDELGIHLHLDVPLDNDELNEVMMNLSAHSNDKESSK